MAIVVTLGTHGTRRIRRIAFLDGKCIDAAEQEKNERMEELHDETNVK